MSENMIIDLTNFKDRVGARVAPGEYLVRIEDAEPDESRNGNPMINLSYRILDGEYADATLIDRLTITDKALFRVVAFLQGIGAPTPKKRFNLNLRTLIGRTLYVTVDDGEPYNGRVKSEVREYRKANKTVPKAEQVDLDDDEEEYTPEDIEASQPDEGAGEPVEEVKAKKQAETKKAPVEEVENLGDVNDELDLDEIQF